MDGRALIDTTRPSAARVWDRLLGGKDNFAADRDAADALSQACPGIGDAARDCRAFVLRAVADLAGKGISQFVDLGCGLPARSAVHETAPGARVVYVDHDPVVLVHARALLQAGGVAVLSADLTDPPAVLWHLEASGAADLGQPCALVLGAVLGCVRAERAGEIVRCYAGALAPGSAVVISLIRVSDPVASARVAGLFPGWQGHGEEQVQAWFDGAGLRIPQKAVSHVGAEWPMVPLSCECRVAGIGAVGIKDPDTPLPRRRRNGSSLSVQRGKT